MSSGDWPAWRGPRADGVADGLPLPTEWSQTENVRWSVKLPGWGTSSAVIHGDRVFVTSEVDEDGAKTLLTLRVLCRSSRPRTPVEQARPN